MRAQAPLLTSGYARDCVPDRGRANYGSARWVLQAQAGAAPGALAGELESGAEFHFAVHNAAGIVSVQEDISVADALIRLRAFASTSDRRLADVARDVIARRLRLP